MTFAAAGSSGTSSFIIVSASCRTRQIEVFEANDSPTIMKPCRTTIMSYTSKVLAMK